MHRQRNLKVIFLSYLVAIGFSCVSQAHNAYLNIYKARQMKVDNEGGDPPVVVYHYFADIKDAGDTHGLFDYGKWKLSKSATKLVIRVHDGAGKVNEVRLPFHVSRGLLNLFKESPNETKCGSRFFDCECFAFQAHGHDPMSMIGKLEAIKGSAQSREKEMREYWQIHAFSDSELQPGDLVRLIDLSAVWPKKGMQHYALYLEPDLYLSKFGNAPVFATNMEEMKKVYPVPPREIWRSVKEASCAEKILADPKTKYVAGTCVVIACAIAVFFY